MMDPVDVKEQYIKALETIRELKKQNNNLQDTLKKLKTRSRWPEHVQAAVLNKEGAESIKSLQQRLEELSNQCSVYEQQIDVLKAQRDQKIESRTTETPKSTRSDEPKYMLTRAEARISTLQSTLQRTISEWKEQDKAYKQQAEEAASRLTQTEERLAQVLRLRTMDSAELIRLARAAKISAAQLTTMQDENQRMKQAVEHAHSRVEELGGLLVEAQQQVVELQEEVAQAQLLRQSMHDLSQELEDLKQERDSLQGHMKKLTAESSKPSDASSDLMVSLQTQLSELQSKLSEETEERQRLEVLLRARQELDSRRQELEAKRQEMRSSDKQLVVKQVELKSSTEETPMVSEVKLQLPEEKKKMEERATQTINTELMDFKPPEVACGLSGEESDRVLAQMYAEIESHRELVRTQTHLTKLCKDEMQALHEQLQSERAMYAAELASKMSRLQELQGLLHTTCTPQDPPPQKQMPKPAPRSLIRTNPPLPLKQAPPFKALELKLVSISASGEGSLLHGSTTNFYIEFTLLPASRAEPQETQGYFCLPCMPNEQFTLDHLHTWDVLEESVSEALFSESPHVQFALVGEPVENAGDGEEDCEEFGCGELLLREWSGKLNSEFETDVPLRDSDGCVLGLLHVSARFV